MQRERIIGTMVPGSITRGYISTRNDFTDTYSQSKKKVYRHLPNFGIFRTGRRSVFWTFHGLKNWLPSIWTFSESIVHREKTRLGQKNLTTILIFRLIRRINKID